MAKTTILVPQLEKIHGDVPRTRAEELKEFIHQNKIRGDISKWAVHFEITVQAITQHLTLNKKTTPRSLEIIKHAYNYLIEKI